MQGEDDGNTKPKEETQTYKGPVLCPLPLQADLVVPLHLHTRYLSPSSTSSLLRRIALKRFFNLDNCVPLLLIHCRCWLLPGIGMTFIQEPDLPFATFLLLNPAPHLPALSSASSAAAAIRARGSGACGMSSTSPPPAPVTAAAPTTVAQALEVARDSPGGADDPTVSAILEAALAAILRRIQARPASYVMTREEFAVFNYFQHRFQGDGLATAARKRYWDHLRAFSSE